MAQTFTLDIGLEIHTQLKTQSKAFCADPVFFGAVPNSLVSPISLGHPGTLPVMNEKVAEYAIRLGLAFGCEINRFSFFDRKNYFYPDLPKGYQITQDKAPICLGGEIRFRSKEGVWKTASLNRIHMEEDAGKSIHGEASNETLIDLNRAGVGLLEIVTEPVLHSAADAAACLMEVRKMVRFLDIADGNMEEGSFRCDANISIRPEGTEKLGSKVEIKNMNSFRHVQKSIDFECKRQSAILESGGEVISETRMFNVESGETYAMRTKETLNDYRYFPDPDLAPLIVSDQMLNDIKAGMPELPYPLFLRFTQELGLPETDAVFLTESRELVQYFQSLLAENVIPKTAANWLMTSVRSWLNEKGTDLDEFPVSPTQLACLIQLVSGGELSHSVAVQELFPALTSSPQMDIAQYARDTNLLLETDDSAVKIAIEQVLDAFPDKVKEYKNGKKALLGMFMGELKKRFPSKADPKVVSKLIEGALADR
jgi:aspartyl-tRNA(Asn)/glutamyl-tRNA(Gln) amidotransferase subunit B